MAEMQDEALDWDVCEADPDDGSHGGWTLLPEGYYPFRVVRMERERYQGSQKMPQCPMAKLTLAVTGADGADSTVQERLYITRKQLWKVSRFMEAVGRGRNADGKVVIDWAGIEGAAGWLKLKVRTYTGRDGQERETNDVEWFCKPEEQEKAWKAYSAACDAAGACPQEPQGAACATQTAPMQQVPASQAYAPQAASYAPQAAPQPQQQYQQTAMAGMPSPQAQPGASQHPGWGIQ